MPIPKPNPNEEKKDFIQRCMSNDTMVSEYKNTDQRLAVCSTTFEDSRNKVELESYTDYPKQATENAKIANAIFIKKFKPFAIFCEKDSNQKIYLVIIDEDKKALVEFSPTPQVNPLVKPINNPIVNSWYFNFDGFNDSVAKKNQLINQGLYECQ